MCSLASGLLVPTAPTVYQGLGQNDSLPCGRIRSCPMSGEIECKLPPVPTVYASTFCASPIGRLTSRCRDCLWAQIYRWSQWRHRGRGHYVSGAVFATQRVWEDRKEIPHRLLSTLWGQRSVLLNLISVMPTSSSRSLMSQTLGSTRSCSSSNSDCDSSRSSWSLESHSTD
jgi:hypothetical protein